MTWPKYVLLGLVAAEVLSMIAVIGRPRRTVRPVDAMAVFVLYTAAAYLVVIA